MYDHVHAARSSHSPLNSPFTVDPRFMRHRYATTAMKAGDLSGGGLSLL
jgi:hypothetical protein